MERRVTKKWVNENYPIKICVPYCAIQSLLAREDRIGYTTRREGWGADIYDIDEIAIVTGYAPFGNVNPSYELCQKYDKLAHEVCVNEWDYLKAKEILRGLLNEFITEARKEG